MYTSVASCIQCLKLLLNTDSPSTLEESTGEIRNHVIATETTSIRLVRIMDRWMGLQAMWAIFGLSSLTLSAQPTTISIRIDLLSTAPITSIAGPWRSMRNLMTLALKTLMSQWCGVLRGGQSLAATSKATGSGALTHGTKWMKLLRMQKVVTSRTSATKKSMKKRRRSCNLPRKSSWHSLNMRVAKCCNSMKVPDSVY